MECRYNFIAGQTVTQLRLKLKNFPQRIFQCVFIFIISCVVLRYVFAEQKFDEFNFRFRNSFFACATYWNTYGPICFKCGFSPCKISSLLRTSKM